MVWVIGAICMIILGAGLVAIGLSLPMLGYAIVGESWSWLVYFGWCPFGDPGVRFPVTCGNNRTSALGSAPLQSGSSILRLPAGLREDDGPAKRAECQSRELRAQRDGNERVSSFRVRLPHLRVIDCSSQAMVTANMYKRGRAMTKDFLEPALFVGAAAITVFAIFGPIFLG